MNVDGIQRIRLVADGCGGQNKNKIVVSMCAKWLLEVAPVAIKSVELMFPVTGHSFLPSDRVFGNIEKRVKRKTVIATPDEYEEIFSEFSTVLKVGEDFPIYDFKTVCEEYLKPLSVLHFKLLQVKRIFFTKSRDGNNILVRGEYFYRNQCDVARSLMKKGTFLMNMVPDILSIGVPVKAEKLKDVQNLLMKHYGTEWQTITNLEWYKKAVCGRAPAENEFCEQLEECIDLRV